MDLVQFSFHHGLLPLCDDSAIRKELALFREIYPEPFGTTPAISKGFFPSEMAFSERLIPLLVESGRWRSQVDAVLVVDCSVQTQIERVMARSGWTREAVQKVVAQQASRAARLGAADVVLCNEGLTLEALQAEVRQVWQHFGL